jgi:predicted PurR-regulated permease PerM
MYVEISLLCLSLAVLLIVAFTVPLLWQVRKFVQGLALTQEMLQKRLPAILQNLEESSGTIKRTAHIVNEQVEAAALTLQKVQAVVGVLMELESVVRLGLRLPLFRFLRNTGAVARGVKVFFDVYTSKPRRLGQ